MSTLIQSQPKTDQDDQLTVAKNVFKIAESALKETEARLGESFKKAIETILNHKGKIVICGIGKSGYVGQKLAATLCSTGTKAIFMHPAEAIHGDLGIYEPGDPTILLSKSGSTAELMRLVPMLKQFNSPLIAMVGNVASPLAEQADVVLDASVSQEADPLGIVPTTSAFIAMILGDALASTLMHAREFDEQDFARFHPGGQLGRNLMMTVNDVLHKPEKIACLSPDQSMREAVIAMTEFPLGAACVLDSEGHLVGLITDGDVRRMLQAHEEIKSLKVSDIMTLKPMTVDPRIKLGEALKIMEDRPTQITVLPVVDLQTQVFLGLVRVHDIYQPEML